MMDEPFMPVAIVTDETPLKTTYGIMRRLREDAADQRARAIKAERDNYELVSRLAEMRRELDEAKRRIAATEAREAELWEDSPSP